MRLPLTLTVLTLTLSGSAHASRLASEPGLDARSLEALLSRAAESESDALIIWKDGRVIVDERFGRPDGPIEAMSATKSVVGLAFGRLLADGRLESLDVPVHRYYPEWNQGRKASITIRHLLTHRSGLQSDRVTTEIYRAPDFVQLALAAELTEDPGATFRYNNKACNLLAGLVEKISGKRLDLFLGEELFAPLGITDWTWSLDRAGNPHAMSGLQVRPSDLLKIGQLMLSGGTWGGKRLLPEDFVREAARDQVHPAPGDDIESVSELWGRRYGYLWWLLSDTNFAITDRLLDEWRRLDAPADFVEKMSTIRDLRGEQLLERSRELAGGEDAWGAATWMANRPDYDVASVTTHGFSAEGYLGQYLVVLPVHRLIAVRMRRSPKGDFDPKKIDSMRDFRKLVLALVPAMD